MLETTISILKDLIAFPTISSDSNLDMIEYLVAEFESIDARIILDRSECGTKGNIFASIGPDIAGGILLSGHSDVVPVTDQNWSSDPFSLRIEDDKVFGRGACDMKGFIAACIALARSIEPHGLQIPLHFAFTYDEEVGCLGAAHLVEVLREHGISPDIAIIGEPTEMRLIVGHKGCNEYQTNFVGLEGHGSEPDAGVNAAEFAALYVSKLLDLRETLKTRAPKSSKFEPPWTTINIGRINAGTATNVIPGRAQVDWEMRPVQSQDTHYVKSSMENYCTEKLLPAMQSTFSEATITTTTIAEVVGLDPVEENEAQILVSQLVGTNSAELVSFGTEAGLFQTLGTSVVVCGPGSIRQAHKPDEFVSIPQLAACCSMLEKLHDHLCLRPMG